MDNNLPPRRSFDVMKKGHRLFIEGHRGVNREFTQNTLKSFAQAINYKLDSIELDIWLTKDKVPIILHGGDNGQLFEYMKNVDKNLVVNDITYDELSKLKFIEDDNQKIPKFEEVLDLCKDKIFINIEMKDPNINETFAKVIELLEKKDMIKQIDISSFHHEYHNLVEKYNETHKDKIEFGYLYHDQKEKEKFKPYRYDTPGCSMNVYQGDLTKEMVDKAHQNDMVVLIWFGMKDKESDELYQKLFDYGIDVICCNEPNKAKEFRDFKYKKAQ